MRYLVRKISKGIWESNHDKILSLMPLSMINKEFSSKDNTLSFWKADSVEEVLDALCIFATNMDTAQTIDVVIIPVEKIKENYIDFTPSIGTTIIEEFKERHYDLHNITYKTLGDLTVLINMLIKSKHSVKLTKAKILSELAFRVYDRRLDVESIKSDSLRNSVIAKLDQLTSKPNIINHSEIIYDIQEQVHGIEFSA